jgi:hypothetical protein
MMTFIVVLMVGMGFVLIASALDGTPLVATFGKILDGGTINWSGTTATTTGSKS